MTAQPAAPHDAVAAPAAVWTFFVLAFAWTWSPAKGAAASCVAG
jgi:hypothetical protein